jgi:hypothetical protein
MDKVVMAVGYSRMVGRSATPEPFHPGSSETHLFCRKYFVPKVVTLQIAIDWIASNRSVRWSIGLQAVARPMVATRSRKL